MENNSSFLGTGWDFPPTFYASTQSVAMSVAEDDIQKSLEILLTTQVGERIMQPDYGCDLTQMIFEPLDLRLATYIQELVKTAILYFEPRIKVENINLNTIPLEGTIIVEVAYVVRTTNSRSNFVYPFYLTEGTSI